MTSLSTRSLPQAAKLAESSEARVLPLTLALLTGDFLQVADVLCETDPSDASSIAALQALLDQSAAAAQDKIAALACVIRESEARADLARAEAERISSHARSARARAEWLRDYLQNNLELLGVDGCTRCWAAGQEEDRAA